MQHKLEMKHFNNNIIEIAVKQLATAYSRSCLDLVLSAILKPYEMLMFQYKKDLYFIDLGL